MSKCIKCGGQVIIRDGLDGMEQLCLSCGCNQLPTITPDQALAADSEDYQARNRSNGWSPTYGELQSPYTIRRMRGQRTNYNKRVGRKSGRKKVTQKDIDQWQTLARP